MTLWDRLPAWVRDHQLATIPKPGNREEDDYTGEHVKAEDIAEAHIITSQDREAGLHRPILDIDFPVHIEQSSTPGHFHLYLDKPMDWDTYRALLKVLDDVGIIEHGYAGVSDARGYTSVRLPWIKKDTAPTTESRQS